MAYAIIQEFNASGDDRSTTNYDTVSERVGIASNPPFGLIVHTAGWDEANGVFRIFDVWESREHADHFWERLQRVLDEVMPPPQSPIPDRERALRAPQRLEPLAAVGSRARNRLSLGVRYNPPPWPATDFVSR